MKSILAIAIMVASTVAGNAASLLGKNLTYCDSNDPRDAERRALCLGYVDGFVQGIQLEAQAAKVGHSICLPPFDPDSDKPAVRVIVDYERKQQKHRGVLDYSAPLDAAWALIGAFPCKKSK